MCELQARGGGFTYDLLGSVSETFQNLRENIRDVCDQDDKKPSTFGLSATDYKPDLIFDIVPLERLVII